MWLPAGKTVLKPGTMLGVGVGIGIGVEKVPACCDPH